MVISKRAKSYKSIISFIALCFVAFAIQFEFFSQTPKTLETNTEQTVFRADNLYQWGSISSFHGLPSEKVNAIVQTQDGLLWFGTEKGLAKFDGRRVQTITTQNLSSLKILALKISTNGTLWIGTETGAFRFENDSFTLVEETRELEINSIDIEEQSGMIYLASTNGKVFESIGDLGSDLKFKTVDDSTVEIKAIAEYDGKLIVGTHKNGLRQIDTAETKELPTKPRSPFVNAFAKDLSGTLWMGTEILTESSGLYRAKNISDWERIDAAVGAVSSLSFDALGNLWVGTKERGAFQFRDGVQIQRFTFENTAGGLRSNEIIATFVDRENVVWFGTNKGVCRFDQGSPKNETISDDRQSNFVRTLFKTKSGILLAGTNRGLFTKSAVGTWNAVAGLDSNPIYAISETASGSLFVGAANGFFYDVDLLTGNKQSFIDENVEEWNEKESVRDIENFRGKTYVAFFGRGVAEFSGDLMNFRKPDSQLAQVTSLGSQSDEKLWVGTAENGVFVFDGNVFSQESQLDQLKGSAIWSIVTTQNHGVWFGTGKGLFQFFNGQLTRFLENSDVRSFSVSVSAEDHSVSVWSATEKGLIRIKSDNDFGWVVSKTEVEQSSNVASGFAVLRTENGDGSKNIIVGTNRGIENYPINPIKPLVIPVRILSKRLHTIGESENGIELEYPQNSISFEFAGLSSRTFPEQFQYSFLLKNSKNELINKKLANDSQFIVENLASGDYTVEIKTFDKDLTSSEPLVIRFSVASAPFPWTTLALTVLLSLAIATLIWAAFSQRRISRTSSELAVANKELNTARLDLANEAERERRRISRDLHDQTLADLRHLLLLTDKLPKDEESRESAIKFRAEIENVSSEIRNICEDLSPSVLENIGFVSSLEWALSNAVQDSAKINSSEFVSNDVGDEQLHFPPHVQIQIYRIIQEVLSNIVQHSNATSIKLSVHSNSDETCQLVVSDNGAKFEKEPVSIKNGRGLTNIQSRANLIGAEASWNSTKAGGNTFILKIGIIRSQN